MTDEFSLDLGSIEETMLGPLWARATYSKLYPEILYDEQAVKIIEEINYDFTNMSEYLEEWRALGLLVRAKCFDDAIINYITEYPHTTVVNIGCGLDTTYSRVNNGTINWYNLDLPSAIKFRNQFISESSRSINIAKSALNYSWMDEINYNSENGIIFFAGGFVYYFEENQIRNFLVHMAEKFPGGEFIFEGISKFAIRIINRRAKKAGVSLRVYYGIGNPAKEFLNWSKNIELIKSHTIWAKTLINPMWSKKTIRMIKISERFKTGKIIHLRFLR